jgi:hypothetical protein
MAISLIPAASAVSGTLPLANGGTGVASVGSSGNVLTSNGSAWVSSAPVFIKSTSFSNGTRTALSNSASASTINSLWSVSVTKINSTSNFNVRGLIQGWSAYNGGATWFVRINGGAWQSGGVHQYNSAVYCNIAAVQSYISASSISAGTVTIEVGWASASGKPFTVWNPNSTDSATEMYYQSYSQLVVDEISG